MLWTAFLWGLGVSCGSAFGLVLFCLLFPFVEFATGRSKKRKNAEAVGIASLAELTRRNDLTEETNDTLDRLVETVDRMPREI